jgi:hypothetical protein
VLASEKPVGAGPVLIQERGVHREHRAAVTSISSRAGLLSGRGLALLIAATLAADAGATGPPDAGVPIWLMAAAPATNPSGEYQLRPLRRWLRVQGAGLRGQGRARRRGHVSRDRKAFFDHVGLIGKPMPPAKRDRESCKELLFGHKAKRRQPVAHATATSSSSPGRKAVEPWSSARQTFPATPCPTAWLSRGSTEPSTSTMQILRALGQDPYRIEKAHFFAATFEFRMKLAVAAHREDMRKSLDHLPMRWPTCGVIRAIRRASVGESCSSFGARWTGRRRASARRR